MYRDYDVRIGSDGVLFKDGSIGRYPGEMEKPFKRVRYIYVSIKLLNSICADFPSRESEKTIPTRITSPPPFYFLILFCLFISFISFPSLSFSFLFFSFLVMSCVALSYLVFPLLYHLSTLIPPPKTTTTTTIYQSIHPSIQNIKRGLASTRSTISRQM